MVKLKARLQEKVKTEQLNKAHFNENLAKLEATETELEEKDKKLKKIKEIAFSAK